MQLSSSSHNRVARHRDREGPGVQSDLPVDLFQRPFHGLHAFGLSESHELSLATHGRHAVHARFQEEAQEGADTPSVQRFVGARDPDGRGINAGQA